MDYQLLTPSILTNQKLSLVEQVFANRGISPQDINHYLNTTKEDMLDPLLLQNMEQGAKMLVKHLAANNKIHVVVDSDMDGYTSAAALINYINYIAPGHAQQYITYQIHAGKEHGIILEEIPVGTKLLIVPDAGSNDILQQEELSNQGIDVLVLDHHQITEVSNYACVINNQDKQYPNKTLSGVGVVYKFCQYLDSILQTDYSNNILDLAAMGIVADMVDLREYETREIVKQGIYNIKNPFLSAFVEKQDYSLKGEVTPFGISFYIAPYVNATIRMGTQQEKMTLFESMLDFKAYQKIPSTKRGCKGQLETIVDQACRNCTNIKSRQTKARDTSLEIIEEIIQEENLLNDPIIIIQLNNPIEETLTGLIANQIMGKYQKPVLLLSKKDGYWRGSGRNSTYSKLRDLRKFLESSGLVEYAAGHPQAFGVSIPVETMDQFKSYIKENLNEADFQSCYYVDFIWSANNAEQNKEDVLKLGQMNYLWGQGLPQPYVAIENITVSANNLTLMSPDKSPTLKIVLPGNLSLIKFKSNKEEYDNLYSETGCVIINIVGTCNINEWMGNISPQIYIEDYEIIKKSAYYF